MTKKQGIRAIIFLLLLFAVFLMISSVLRYKTYTEEQRFNTFYAEEKDSLDAIYIGGSGVDRYWAAPLAWNKHGIAVYPLSIGAQPLAAVKGFMREALKTQSPELFIIDIRNIKRDLDVLKPGTIHQSYERFRSLSNRFLTAKEVLDFKGVSRSERLSYYIPIIKNHSRWSKGLSKNDFVKPYSPFKGMYYSKKLSHKIFKMEEISSQTNEEIPIAEEMESCLRDILDFCKSEKLEVLFVASPFQVTEDERKMFNYAENLINEYKYTFLDFNNLTEEIGLDFSKDFFDNLHVNMKGAFKYTNYFSDYLVDNYKMEDKSGSDDYKSWDESYDNLKQILKDKSDFRLD